jgi:hypothetical protein
MSLGIKNRLAVYQCGLTRHPLSALRVITIKMVNGETHCQQQQQEQ